jgi:hypothetical protein
MATVKKGMLTAAGEWWKHFRSTKRKFWKRERRAARKAARKDVAEPGCGWNPTWPGYISG